MTKTKDPQSTGTTEPKHAPQDAKDGEMSAEELEQVDGGIGLLLPAVQKVRDAAAPSPGQAPLEEVSFNYAKIMKK